MNIRYDVANYHRSTDEEKDAFWLKEINRHYSTISLHSRIQMTHTSKLVEAYIASTEDEKRCLWRLYDEFSQLYSDNEKYIEKVKRRNALKEVS